MDETNGLGTAPPSDQHATRKRWCLGFLLLWAVISGVISGLIAVEWQDPWVFVDVIVCTLAIITWTYSDAALHNYRPWRFFIPMMIICPGPLIVMPIYFVRTRGWSKGIGATLLALGFMVLQSGVGIAVAYAVISLVTPNGT